MQEFLGAFEPHLVPDFGWECSQLGQSPTCHYGAPPQSELGDGIVSSCDDDPFARLALTQVGSDGYNFVMEGYITSGSSELNESPASGDSAWSLEEIGEQATADHSPAASNRPFAAPVSATRNIDLLRTNAGISILQTKHQTTLHRAIVTGNVEIVQLLLQHGATVDLQNHVGMTPLHLAVHCRNAVLVTLLLQYNADLEARDIQGRKALDLAVEAEDFPIVALLIAHGTSM